MEAELLISKENIIVNNWDTLKQDILNGVESREDGLDMIRVRNFFEKNGLKFSTVLFVNKEGKEKIASFFDNRGFVVPVDCFNNQGRFVADLDICFVQRDFKDEEGVSYEDTNGPLFTEGVAVHEAFHGTGNSFFMETQDVQSRIGFLSQNKNQINLQKGSFFEEGFAELFRVRYLMDNGWDVRGDDEGQEFIFYNSKQEERARFQSIAGIGLKKLIEDKPIIWELLIAARKDIDGLRSFIKKLEELYPGLYKQLRDLQHNEQSFMDGLRLINSYIKK